MFVNVSKSCLTDCLVASWVGWLLGGFLGWLVVRLARGRVGCLVGDCLVRCLIGKIVDWMVGWQDDGLVASFVVWLERRCGFVGWQDFNINEATRRQRSRQGDSRHTKDT